jgi:hypothetical protein
MKKQLLLFIIVLISCSSKSVFEKNIIGKWYAISVSSKDDFVIGKIQNNKVEIWYDFKKDGSLTLFQDGSIKNPKYTIQDSLLVLGSRKYRIHSISEDTMKLLDFEDIFNDEFYYYVRNKIEDTIYRN